MKQYIVTTEFFKLEVNANGGLSAIFYFQTLCSDPIIRLTEVTQTNILLNNLKLNA